MNKLKRYFLFLVGLFINSLGVSLVTRASLGTSPISSIPYVLSLNFPFTLGNFTIVFSLLLIALQILILRKNFKIENILQIPVYDGLQGDSAHAAAHLHHQSDLQRC